MNNFDFFTVEATSSSIRSLMGLSNVTREKINSQVDRSGRFPKTTHKTTLAFFNVMGVGHQQARNEADVFVDKMVNVPSNVRVSVKFWPVD